MTRFYLLPLDVVGNARGPKYLKWRFNPTGLTGAWSLKDFGSPNIGLVICENEIKQPDVIEIGIWSQKQRDAIAAYLNNSGIEAAWVNQAADWREGLHRLAGLSLAMAEDNDTPDRWLGRPVYCGFAGLNPLDWRVFEEEQQARLDQIAEYLQVRDTFDRKSPDWRDILKLAIDNPLALPFMTLPANDAFTASNGTALQTYNSNWVINTGAFAINTNAVYANSGSNESGAHRSDESWNNDQYAQISVAAVGAGAGYIGPAVRCAASGGSYYGFYGSNNDSFMFKMVSGSWTQSGSTGAAFSAGQTAYLVINGTTLTPKINGSTLSPPGAQTITGLTSGYGGICGYNASTNTRGDDWSSGNLGGAYTITAAQAGFTLTRQPANLLFGRKLAAGQASFAETGQAANLLFGRLLTADQAGVALTGQDANLLFGRLLAADQAGFALTGAAVNLLFARILAADQASLTLSGQDANLLFGRLLAADQAGIALTGLDVTLTYSGAAPSDYTLAADQASLTLSGQDANLLFGRLLAADQAGFALTGAAVNLLFARIFAADQASLTLSGQDANLLFGRLLAADQAGVALTGAAAGLFAARLIAAIYRAYSLTGNLAVLRYSGAVSLTPDGRVYLVAAEERILTVAGESRLFEIEFEDRVYSVGD